MSRTTGHNNAHRYHHAPKAFRKLLNQQWRARSRRAVAQGNYEFTWRKHYANWEWS